MTRDVARGVFSERERISRDFADVTVVTDDPRQRAIQELRPLLPGKHTLSLPPKPTREKSGGQLLKTLNQTICFTGVETASEVLKHRI